MNLFKNRGWTALITDQLVGNVIGIMVLLIGLLCGGIGYLAWVISPDSFVRDDSGAQWVLFVVGCLLGWCVSAILLQTVMSVTDAVFVCFADAPRELAVHHPELAAELNDAWRKFHPGYENSRDNSAEKRE